MRWLFSWAFYWLGDGFYRVYDFFWPPRELVWAYTAYQWSMRVADTIQGEADKGPWERHTETK